MASFIYLQKLLKWTPLFLGLTGAISGCSHNQITYKDMALPDAIKPGYSVPEHIPAEQWNYDKRVLLHNLEQGYAGRFNINKALLSKAHSSISAIKGQQNTKDLCEKLAQIFAKLPDNHLKVYRQGQSCLPPASPQIDIGQSLSKSKDKVWLVEKHRKKNKRILYISISEFPSHKNTVWNGFLDKVKKLHQQTDVVVLDLRGNGGGDDTTGYMLSAYFHKANHHSDFPTPYGKQITSQTPETQTLKINSAEVKLRFNKSQANLLHDWKKESEDILDKVLNGALPKVRITPEEPLDTHWKFTGFRTPIYILIDGNCGSSCESSVDAFDYNPYAKKIGRSTSGTVHFGNIALLYLPHSLLAVQTPTHANFYRDGRFIEKSGIKPDIEVPESKDAYQFLIEKVL